MSLIHKNLYSKDNLTGIKMKDYLSDLCQNLVNTYSVREGQVTLNSDIEDINLDVDSVVPIGLIMNELITNALKYAFPDERKGTIYISLKEIDATLCIMVKDDGVGISDMELVKGKNSFGYRLINSFARKLNATLAVDGSDGTQVDVCISEYEKMELARRIIPSDSVVRCYPPCKKSRRSRNVQPILGMINFV